MTTPDKVIDQFRRKLAWLFGVRAGLIWLAAWVFLWGLAVLILRVTLAPPRSLLLWGLTGVPVVLIPALLLARRQLPSRSSIRALLDRHNALGGLLMAGAECSLGLWEEKLSTAQAPEVHWHARRQAGVLAAGVVFLLAGLLVPERLIARGSPPLDVGHEVQRLTHQLEVLKEEKLLDPERAENLQKKLGQVRAEARGKDPVKTLEALDRVGDVTSKTAKEAAEEALRKTEKLAQSEALADALRRKKRRGDGLSSKALRKAMEELATLTRKAAQENEKLRKSLDEELSRELDGEMNLSPEQLEKLARALKDAKGDLARMLGKLEKVRLIDADKLKECKECGQMDGEALARLLKEHEKDLKSGKCSMAQLLALCRRGGRGGITRGPGPADLTFGKPTSEVKGDLDPKSLPPGRVAEIKQSLLQGVSVSAPKVGEGGPGSAGALAGAASGGGSANTQIVLPRHRGAVRRYFDRPATPKP
jgi:hypothetical protein